MWGGGGSSDWKERHRPGWGGLESNWEGKNGELSRNKLDTSFTARDVGQEPESKMGSGEDCSFFKMRDITAVLGG